jgi:hypothetical protein
MPYRNSTGGRDPVVTYVFATPPIMLQAGKQLQSVTLPNAPSGGALHVFAIGTG